MLVQYLNINFNSMQLEEVIHSYWFINVTCQNARTYTTYGSVNDLHELMYTAYKIINMLVKLSHKNMTEKMWIGERNVSEMDKSFVAKFCPK